MKKSFTSVFLIGLLNSLGLCSEAVENHEYLILYPLETTSQEMQVYDGNRFTETGDGVKVALGVLNNPLVNSTYADVALFAMNGSDEPLTLSVSSVRSREGELQILTPESLGDRILSNDIFMEKVSIEELAPKIQAYGCSPKKAKDTLSKEKMSALQQSVADFQSTYKLKLPQYLQSHLFTQKSIEPGSIGGGILRIMLPPVKEDGPMLLKFRAGNQNLTLRLQLQRLD